MKKLKEAIESQTEDVLNSFKEGKSTFEDFKSQIEKVTKLAETTKLASFVRQYMIIHQSVFTELEFEKSIIIKVDENINLIMREMKQQSEVYGCSYVHIITGNETTNDVQIVSSLGIDTILPIEEIIGNAVYLIREDLNQHGPLYEPDVLMDRNINIGYMLIENKVYSVYVERIKQIAKREYHVHSSMCPRLYKPNRHIIW